MACSDKLPCQCQLEIISRVKYKLTGRLITTEIIKTVQFLGLPRYALKRFVLRKLRSAVVYLSYLYSYWLGKQVHIMY